MNAKIDLPEFPIQGGCQCGAVRYTLRAPPVVFYICHCSECQTQSSSGFGESMRVRKADLEISGALHQYERPSASGGVVGEFCPNCGTRLFHGRGAYKDTLNIKAGTLDDTSWLRPAGHIWTQSKQPWVKIGANELAYARQPEDGYAALTARWNEMMSPKGPATAPARVAGLRRQYHFRPSARGYYAWDVHRLITLSKNLPRQAVAPETIAELGESYWFSGDNANPSGRDLLEHIRLMNEVDFDHPIILCAEGRLMDGMHRVMKAVLEGRQSIAAVRFETTPEPDYVDVQADELSYD